MYRPSLRPGENLIKTSPGVTVKNVLFDAFLTSKRIIFVKKTDDLQERKELVFPLNLVKDFKPSSDQSGTPDIRFSIEKPSGEVGDLVLRFVQTGDYRYAERDDWIENLKNLSRGITPRGSSGGQDLFSVDPAPGAISQKPTGLYDDGGAPGGYDPDPVYGVSMPADPGFGTAAGGFAPPPPPVQDPYAPRPGPGPDPQAPVFCRFCGAKVPQGSAFCPSCGGKLEQQAGMQPPAVSREPVYRPPAGQPPVSPPPPPVQSGGGGFVAPPPPPPPGQAGFGRQPGYNPRDGGISMADDRAYDGASMSQKDHKVMMKQQAKAEKARLKEHKMAQKSAGYDPYGYSESRMPEPKVLIMIVAVIAVIAFAGYAFTSGMLGGGGGGDPSSPAQTPGNTDVTTNPTNPLGSASTSDTYGNWYFSIFYPGEWSGSYTVNGATKTITDDFGESPLYGAKPNQQLGTFSGTVVVTANILDEGAGGNLEISLYDEKGKEVAKEISSGSSNTVTLTYP